MFVDIFLPKTRFFLYRSIFLRYCRVYVGFNSKICGGCKIYGRGNIYIGTNTWVSMDCIFYTSDNASIQIGNNCDIGPYSKFITGSHTISNAVRRAGNGISGEIVVKDNVWICADVLILGGVTVQNNVVIAAKALVNKNLSDNCLYAGVPAKVKKILEWRI